AIPCPSQACNAGAGNARLPVPIRGVRFTQPDRRFGLKINILHYYLEEKMTNLFPFEGNWPLVVYLGFKAAIVLALAIAYALKGGATRAPSSTASQGALYSAEPDEGFARYSPSMPSGATACTDQRATAPAFRVGGMGRGSNERGAIHESRTGAVTGAAG